MTDAPLNLLAPDGIVRVTFGQPLTAEQALAVIEAAQSAESADELEQAIYRLGQTWGLRTSAEITAQSPKPGHSL